MTFDELFKIIENRKKKSIKNSYIASLFNRGRDSILQKVGEEAVEVIISGKKNNKKEIIAEISDLLFHVLILLSFFNIKPIEILNEFERRKKINISQK